MIKKISWNEIFVIWNTELWPNRKSKIEANSAMCYLDGIDIKNMYTSPTFFGYVKNGKILGVNSGHKCYDDNYRSRGLWVDPNYRNQGIGTKLLLATIEQAEKENANFIWSFPRYSSWNTYKNAGFRLTSEWKASETSESNAYCVKELE